MHGQEDHDRESGMFVKSCCSTEDRIAISGEEVGQKKYELSAFYCQI